MWRFHEQPFDQRLCLCAHSFCSSLVSLSISSDGDAALIRASCSNPSTSKGIQYGAGCSRSAYPCQRCKLRPANNRFVAAASSPCFEPGGQLPHGTGDEIHERRL